MLEPQRGGLVWSTAAACGAHECVEVAPTGSGVAIRDSKDPEGAILRYSKDEWNTFLSGAKNGDFDGLVPS